MQILVVKQPSCVIRLISTSTSSATLERYNVGSLALCICQLLEFMLSCGWLGGTYSALLEQVGWH